jgi:hypothetical protein
MHPPKNVKKRHIFWKPMFRPKRFLQKSTSYGSSGRSAWGKILVHWSSNFHTFLENWVFTTKKRPFTSSFWSRPQVFMKKDFFIWSLLWFISCRTYSLLRRVRHNSKIESKSDLLNQKYPKMSFFMRNDWKWIGPTNEWAQQGPTNEWPQQGPTNEWAQQGPTNEWAQGPGPTGPNKWMAPTGPNKWMGPTGPNPYGSLPLDKMG